MPLEIENLLQRAAEFARSLADASAPYWQVVIELHGKPSGRVFEQCITWCTSPDPRERRLGADVLGQLGYEGRAFPFRSESVPVLHQLLTDPDAGVVSSSLLALGHLRAERSVALIAPLSRHPSPEVRHAVVFSLLTLEHPLAIDTLLHLSRDPVSDVRDWATFGLGSQTDLDTPQIRDALLSRATDPDDDTRAEALAGLLKRRDQRIISLLRHALDNERASSRERSTAHDLGSNDLVTTLERLRARADLDHELLESAISQCRTPPRQTD